MMKNKPIFGSYTGNWVITGVTFIFGLAMVIGSYTIDPAIYPGQNAGAYCLGYLLLIPSVLWMGFLTVTGVIGWLLGCDFIKKNK